MSKRKYTYLFVITSLVLLLSLVGLTGCPTPGKFTLTTNVSPPGAGSVSPSGGDYDSGMSVTLTAAPASGYTFDYWGGSASGTNTTTTIIMDSDKSVTAYFEAAPITKFTLTTNVSPSGAGSISPSGGDYDSGATVTLTATAASDYTFDYWSGSASGTDTTTTITMDSDKSVTANFKTAGPTALFSDDFSQDTGVWDIFYTADGEAFYENGWLHVINYTAAGHTTASEANRNFTDFILEVDMKLVAGTIDNWQSVMFRYSGPGTYYSAEISADGFYEMQRWVNGTLHTLVYPTMSNHIRQGHGVVNSVRIECVGNRLSLSVNGYLLAEVFDDTLTSGSIAFEVHSIAGGTFSEVAFDNLVVTEP